MNIFYLLIDFVSLQVLIVTSVTKGRTQKLSKIFLKIVQSFGFLKIQLQPEKFMTFFQIFEMKWFRDHVLTSGYIRDFMLTVDIDRLKLVTVI
jgi:hypothetical protein